MAKIKTNINDTFWSGYCDLVRNVVIPYQRDALNDRIEDADPSRAIRNLRIAAGEEQGEFYGMNFQDSDVAKWLEAVAYSLETHPDPVLEKEADEVIDLIGRVQQPDGYLNSYYIITGLDKRWTNLNECHELYCAGHLIEAAVAYYEATGKRKLLDIGCRFADHIDTVFGPEEGKKKGYPGHQEIELALLKLYRLTQNERYLKLAKYLLDERGREPFYFDIEWERRGRTSYWTGTVCNAPSLNKEYNQSHLPIREQTKATGHSVRAVYMYTAMADMAAETGDEQLLEACRRLWKNIVSERMYITGGIGSQVHGEAFSFDYDLPNDTTYAETCAAIGLVFFADRMLKAEPKGEYADVLERALYNGVISGMSLDGRRFFYVNPLEVDPDACKYNGNFRHVKPTRQKWFGCACCPPNIARLLASLGHYIYDVKDDTIYTHLYIGSEANLEVDGARVGITQRTDYPWDGKITFILHPEEAREFGLAVRIPGWCKNAVIKINSRKINIADISGYANTADKTDKTDNADTTAIMSDGYVIIRRLWETGDKLELELEMVPTRLRANPRVRADIGKAAIQCGPIVYCLEEADNGSNLHCLVLPKDASLKTSFREDMLGGINVITAEGKRINEDAWGSDLYMADAPLEYEPVSLTFIPYYAWANRQVGEMTVWVREKEKEKE